MPPRYRLRQAWPAPPVTIRLTRSWWPGDGGNGATKSDAGEFPRVGSIDAVVTTKGFAAAGLARLWYGRLGSVSPWRVAWYLSTTLGIGGSALAQGSSRETGCDGVLLRDGTRVVGRV